MSTKVEGYGVKADSKALDMVILVGGLASVVGIGYTLWKVKQAAEVPSKVAGAINNTLNQMGQKTILPPYIEEISLSQLSPLQLTTFKTITAENKGAETIPDVLAQASQLTTELSEAAGKSCALNWYNGQPKLECFNVAPQEVKPDVVASVAGIDFVKQCPDGYSRPYFGSECIKGETSALGASITTVESWLGSLW